MNEVVHQTQQQNALIPAGGTPFGGSTGLALSNVNAGAVAIETERAVAEARGQMQLAKMFPRDGNAAFAELMDACKLKAFAEVAFYSVPQGGSKVTGPSIRFAEEVARVYGNFEFGHRELSRVEAGPGQRDFGRSEIEVYAWDKEKNNRSIRQITVLHVIDTRDGPRKLRDQKEIDNKIANVASKQARGRILALMPKWLVEAGLAECRKTLAGDNTEPLSARIRKMQQAFSAFGVTTDHLERYLGHKLDDTLADELVDLMGVYNAVKEGTPPSEFFGASEEDTKAATGAAITDAAKAAAAAEQSEPAASAKVDKPSSQQRKANENSSKAVKAAEPAKQDNAPAAEASQPAQTGNAASTDPEDVF